MRRISSLSTAVLACGLLAFSGAHAQSMNAGEYKAAQERVSAEYKAAKAACDSMSGNAEDVCEAEATGKRNVAMAELEHARSGKTKDMTKATLVRADAAYAVAKEKCDDLGDNRKDVCVKEAKAAQTKAKADAQSNKASAQARNEAADEKRDADYSVAREKCDALSGDARSSCVAAAKAKYGKS